MRCFRRKLDQNPDRYYSMLFRNGRLSQFEFITGLGVLRYEERSEQKWNFILGRFELSSTITPSCGLGRCERVICISYAFNFVSSNLMDLCWIEVAGCIGLYRSPSLTINIITEVRYRRVFLLEELVAAAQGIAECLIMRM